MTQKWNNLKRELWNEAIDGNPKCKYCGMRDAVQLAHAIVHRRYKKKRKAWMDVRENACECCNDCQQFSETFAGRSYAYHVNCHRYGFEHMSNWYAGLPLKIKETFNGQSLDT